MITPRTIRLASLAFIVSPLVFLALFTIAPVSYAQSAPAQSVGTPAQSPSVGTPAQSPSPTPAADTSGTTGVGLVNPLKNITSLDGLLTAVLSAIVTLGTIFLTLAFIYVGFLFVMARGKEEQIRSARSALVWTVIGGLILLGAQAIGVVIKSTVSGL